MFATLYFVVLPTSFVLMVIGVVGMIWLPWRLKAAPVAVLALQSCNKWALAILLDPQFRYQLAAVPLAIARAGFGIHALLRLVGTLRPRTAASP